MKYCTACGAQLSDTAAFCGACGAKVEAVSATEAVTAAATPATEATPAAPRRSVKETVFSFIALGSAIEGAVIAGIMSFFAVVPVGGIIYNLVAPLPAIFALVFAGLVHEPTLQRRAGASRLTARISIIVSAVALFISVVWTVCFFAFIAQNVR